MMRFCYPQGVNKKNTFILSNVANVIMSETTPALSRFFNHARSFTKYGIVLFVVTFLVVAFVYNSGPPTATSFTLKQNQTVSLTFYRNNFGQSQIGVFTDNNHQNNDHLPQQTALLRVQVFKVTGNVLTIVPGLDYNTYGQMKFYDLGPGEYRVIVTNISPVIATGNVVAATFSPLYIAVAFLFIMITNLYFGLGIIFFPFYFILLLVDMTSNKKRSVSSSSTSGSNALPLESGTASTTAVSSEPQPTRREAISSRITGVSETVQAKVREAKQYTENRRANASGFKQNDLSTGDYILLGIAGLFLLIGVFSSEPRLLLFSIILGSLTLISINKKEKRRVRLLRAMYKNRPTPYTVRVSDLRTLLRRTESQVVKDLTSMELDYGYPIKLDTTSGSVIIEDDLSKFLPANDPVRRGKYIENYSSSRPSVPAQPVQTVSSPSSAERTESSNTSILRRESQTSTAPTDKGVSGTEIGGSVLRPNPEVSKPAPVTSDETKPKTKFCVECGTGLPESARYCYECGSRT